MKKGTSLKDHKITINKMTFRSFNSACTHYGVNIDTGNSRLQRGWSLEEIFSLTSRVKKSSVTIQNTMFTSIQSASKYYGVERRTVERRIKRGWSIEEALELVKQKVTSKCRGKLYVIRNSINRKRYYGITVTTLSQRFNKHKSDALDGCNRKLYRAMRKYGIENFYITLVKEVDSKERLRKVEIKYINHYNTVEKGYNTIVGGGHLGDKFGKSVTYKGIKYPSIASLAGALNLSTSALCYRVKHGLPLEITRRIEVQYKNKTFRSIAEFAEYKGLAYKTVHKRLSKGTMKNAKLLKSSPSLVN
jgi:hypothetical protein